MQVVYYIFKVTVKLKVFKMLNETAQMYTKQPQEALPSPHMKLNLFFWYYDTWLECLLHT